MRRALSGIAATVATVCAISRPALCQSASGSDEQTRQLWDDAFRKKRQEAGTAQATRARPAPSPGVGSPVKDAVSTDDVLVGVTLWRLRPAAPSDRSSGAVLFPYGGEELVAERVEATTTFKPGDKVRIGIEAARPGYLYLIDREKYQDGTLGDPYLIFPRSRIRGGDNRVVAGRLVEVPDAADTPPFFTMRRNRPDQEGDVLTLLLTPEPVPDVPTGRNAAKLPRDQVEKWERAWRKPSQRLELPGGCGRLYLTTEASVDSDVSARLLTQEEPLPQTMYRLEAKAGEPILLTVIMGVR